MKYVKDQSRLMVKFVREEDEAVILQVPSTPLELHDFFKADYIQSVLKNTFGEDKFDEIGNVVLIIDQKYVLTD